MKNIILTFILFCLLPNIKSYACTTFDNACCAETICKVEMDHCNNNTVRDSTEVIFLQNLSPIFRHGMRKIVKWKGEKINKVKKEQIRKAASDYCNQEESLSKPFILVASLHLDFLLNSSFLGLEPISHDVNDCWICLPLLSCINEK